MTPPRPRSSKTATFVVLTAAVGAYSLMQSLVIPVLPTIQAGLHTSQNSVTWVLTAYLLSASIFTPIMGRLGDMWGKERMLVAALVALALGSLIAALAGSLSVMIAARAIQGIGGGVLPLSFGIVRDEFPQAKVASAVGALAALAAAGGGLGIALAGPIVDATNYHWLFWIPLIALVITVVVAHMVIPESPIRTAGRVSWAGVALLSAWLVALMLGISQAPTWGWTSARVIGLLVSAAVLVVAWVVVESRSTHPLIDMRMMRAPAVWTTNLVALLLGMGMYAVFAFLPEFLQTPTSTGYGFGVSITRSGFVLLPATIFMFVFGILAGPMSKRYGSKLVLIAGLLVGIVSFSLLTFAHATQEEIVLAMVFQGIAFGLAFSSMASLIVEAVPPEQTGVASGMNANIRTIGGAIGAAAMSSIVTSSAHAGGLPRESGYTLGFALLMVTTAAAAGAALLIPRARPIHSPVDGDDRTAPHAELALVAGGTLVGDEAE